MTEDLLAVYLRAADLAVGIVDAIGPDQFGLATPCREWDVRMVMNHVVSGNRFFVHLVTGAPPPQRGGDHLGDDPVAAFRDSVRAVSAAFLTDGFLDRVVTAPFGDVPGRQLVDMRRNELTVHAWDLAKATGQPTDLDPEVIAGCRASYEASPALRDRASAPFDDEQPAPPGATDADRLAAFLGRAV
jgi:uncharacterized protein (TIGR03086 family)